MTVRVRSCDGQGSLNGGCRSGRYAADDTAGAGVRAHFEDGGRPFKAAVTPEAGKPEPVRGIEAPRWSAGLCVLRI